MKVLGKISDRMLSAFLPRTDAGACVPENGQKFWTGSGCSCSSDRRYYHRQCTYKCDGTTTCTSCQRTQSIC